MSWMNEYDVADARERYAAHPVLGPATMTLANLVEWTNANSDGWPYWRKPSAAAGQLMDLIQGYIVPGSDRCKNCQAVAGYHTRWCSRPDATRPAVRKACRAIKSFRTRNAGADHGRPWFEIAEV